MAYSVQRKWCLITMGLVDFAVRLVNSVLNLPEGQVIFLVGIQFEGEL